jgi:adenylylsulfate kinase
MGRIENLQDTTPQVFWHASAVTAEERLHQLRQQPATIWLTGLSGAGKSTPGLRAGTPPVRRRPLVYVLDGDNLRHHLNSDLGFSSRDRRENIRRSAEVARLLNDAGLIVICAFISPLREDRAMAQAIIGQANFIETYVSTPCAVCEERDPKGLYQKARAGLIPEFTGISAPYEVPLAPALVLDTELLTPDQACARLLQHLAPRLR